MIDSKASALVDRLVVPSATGMTWTADGLYVTCGYTGTIARFAYDAKASKAAPVLSKRADLQVGKAGLLNGVAEDPVTQRVVVARSAEREVVVLDDRTGNALATLRASGQPFSVGFAGTTLVATLYDSDHVDAWRNATGDAVRIATGPHPTALLIDGKRVFVANADGHTSQ